MKNFYQCLGVSVAVLLANTASAVSFNASSWPGPFSGITITSSGTLETKSFAGFTGLGVQGGNVGGEIDTRDGESSEWINFQFSTPTLISDLTIGTLYPNGEFNDSVNEAARITVNGSSTYQLQATGFTTATWNGSGSVANVSPARDGNPVGEGAEGFGAWKITNPFGNLLVTSLRFTPRKLGDDTGRDSDFTIVSLNSPAASLPVADAGSSMALLGMGLLSIVGLSRWTARQRA